MNQESLDMMEYPFLTMSKYPPGFVMHLGILLCNILVMEGGWLDVTPCNLMDNYQHFKGVENVARCNITCTVDHVMKHRKLF
jgi:hypothetical protein